MARIHHATLKKAKKFGIHLEQVVDEFEASKDGETLASAMSASVALEQAIAALGGDATQEKPKRAAKRSAKKVETKPLLEDDEEDGEDDEGDEEQEESGGASIVKKKYKKRYRPFHMKCGDELSGLISNHVGYEDEAGEWKVDPAKLKRFAKANGCWVEDYKHLNIGQQRMNIGNRLRPLVRKGHDIVWA